MIPAQQLLQWYDQNGRDLPWRKTRDPYRILVSELMLQQTQVARVMLFYDRWLKQFPDWKTLANASNAEVIRAWAGLGYNRRALALRDIARHVIKNGVPSSEEEWLALKGIGPYTAAAVSVFSLHLPTFPVDSIIRRIAGRILLGKTYPQPEDDNKIKRHSCFPTNVERFYDIPQALFDLATAVCKKEPDCAVCPLRTSCLAANKFLSGRVRTPKAMIKKGQETKQEGKPFPDRIYRGRILQLVHKTGGVTLSSIGKRIDGDFAKGQDEAWLLRMLDRMEKDRLITRRGNRIIPNGIT